MRLGPVIRFHRKAAGISQQELAKLAGVGKTSIFDIEKGKLGVRFDTLVKVCQVLNIKLNWESRLKEAYQHSITAGGDEKS